MAGKTTVLMEEKLLLLYCFRKAFEHNRLLKQREPSVEQRQKPKCEDHHRISHRVPVRITQVGPEQRNC